MSGGAAPATAAPAGATLDDEQRAVVEAGGGATLVVAGAGSGKTRALTHRVARLVAAGARPERILLATFTNRAAREMIGRVEQLTGSGARGIFAGTFHSLAHRIVRLHGDAVGLDPRFHIIDRDDARELLGRCLADEAGRGAPSPALLQRALSLAAAAGETLDSALARVAPRADPACARRAADRFSRRKAELRLVDFDDLLLLWKILLVDQPRVRRQLEDRFEHVLVDEYQDATPLQAELMERSSAAHGNLLVVGDDAQSIYRFRGADVELLLDFQRRFPDARTLKLTTNYRSSPEIVALANRSIGHNVRQHEKRLVASRPLGLRPSLLACEDELDQARRVADRVQEIALAGRSLAEVAVLYRNHAHSLELQVELSRRRLRYVVRSGPRFFEQAHVRDAVSALRAHGNGSDELAWARLVRQITGLGRATAAKLVPRLVARGRGALSDAGATALARASATALLHALEEVEEAGPSPGAMLRAFVVHHYRSFAEATLEDAPARLDELERLAGWADRYESAPDFLAELALVSSSDDESARARDGDDELGGATDDAPLTLSTVHQAKGLEWRELFLLGLADGHFPQSVTLRGSPEEEEERRLFYVAVTRARDHLWLCHPRTALLTIGGPRTGLLRSRFLDEVAPLLAPA